MLMCGRVDNFKIKGWMNTLWILGIPSFAHLLPCQLLPNTGGGVHSFRLCSWQTSPPVLQGWCGPLETPACNSLQREIPGAPISEGSGSLQVVASDTVLSINGNETRVTVSLRHRKGTLSQDWKTDPQQSVCPDEALLLGRPEQQRWEVCVCVCACTCVPAKAAGLWLNAGSSEVWTCAEVNWARKGLQRCGHIHRIGSWNETGLRRAGWVD